jgi:hypothetical protein
VPPPVQTNIQSLKPPTQPPIVSPPVTPVKQVNNKSSVGKFAIFGTLGAVVIAVLVYFIFIKESSSENLWVGEEPWIINPDYGYYYYPAERDSHQEDPTLTKSANWQATAQKKTAATF